MGTTVDCKRDVKINKDELDWYKDKVAIRKLLVFLGRINNLNGNMFYRTFPYWDIQPDWWCQE
jgi:hypothetical protein